MPKHCKELFVASMDRRYTILPMTEDNYKSYNKLTEDGKEFVLEHRTLKDFCLGLSVPEKLMPRRIDGGVLLVSTTYKMR